MLKRCPGVRELVEPSIMVRTCPVCGGEVEFFSDETLAECPNCGKPLHREATSACVTWCQYAEACVEDLENRGLITHNRAEDLRRRVHRMKT